MEIDTAKIRLDAKQLFNHDALLGTIDLLCYAVENANRRIGELNEELDVAYRQRNDALEDMTDARVSYVEVETELLRTKEAAKRDAKVAEVRAETAEYRIKGAISYLPEGTLPYPESGIRRALLRQYVEPHQYVECLECLCGDCLVCDEEESQGNHIKDS